MWPVKAAHPLTGSRNSWTFLFNYASKLSLHTHSKFRSLLNFHDRHSMSVNKPTNPGLSWTLNYEFLKHYQSWHAQWFDNVSFVPACDTHVADSNYRAVCGEKRKKNFWVTLEHSRPFTQGATSTAPRNSGWRRPPPFNKALDWSTVN